VNITADDIASIQPASCAGFTPDQIAAISIFSAVQISLLTQMILSFRHSFFYLRSIFHSFFHSDIASIQLLYFLLY
jgi:hypothetical protein